MPAEWEPQESVWLAWPTNLETWPPDLLAEVRETYVEIIAALLPDQGVSLLVDDSEAEGDVRDRVGAVGADADAIRFRKIPTIDTWIRDYGPTFVVNDTAPELAMVSWTFNAWGHKYPDLEADDGVPARLNRDLRLKVFDAEIVLEGGSIEVNGRGTVLTTEQCLLNRNRNPGLTRRDLERCLHEFIGTPNVVWLGEGISGDDTDGHIDDIARFVDARTILCAFEEDTNAANYGVLLENYQRLRSAGDVDGNSFDVRKLPMPEPVAGPDGPLPASYANFYIGNRTVVVPVFGQGRDRGALEAIQSCFPRRRVVGVDSTALVHGLGAVHCCSQQQPRAGS